MIRAPRLTTPRVVALARSPRLLSLLVLLLIGLLFVAGVRACVLADHHVRLRNDFAGPIIVQRLDPASDAARTLAPGESLVLRYGGKHRQLQEITGLGPVPPAEPRQPPSQPVVLGVFSADGQPLGRLVASPGAGESYTMCLSAAAEPPHWMGGAVRGGRSGELFCPRGIVTHGPPLP
jgi:hypothetical protein